MRRTSCWNNITNKHYWPKTGRSSQKQNMYEKQSQKPNWSKNKLQNFLLKDINETSWTDNVQPNILVLILSLIFGWTLSVQDVSLISFGRKFCNFFWINLVFEITFDTCFSFDLICLFWVNSVYLLCCFNMKFFSFGIDIKFDIWLNIICSRCFIDIFW